MAVTPVRDRTKPKGPDGKFPVIPNLFDVVVWGVRTEGGRRERATRRVRGGRRDAERVERELLAKRDRQEPLGKAPTFAEWAEIYFKSRRRSVTARTLSGYRDMVRWYLAPTLGDRRLTAITKSMIDGLESDLLDAGKAPGTVRAAHRVLSLVMQGAVAEGLITVNPARLVRPPKGKARERGIEPEEAKRLLAQLGGSDLHNPLALAAVTGVRRGELLALRWQDVDFEAEELHVRQAVEQIGQEVSFKTPKSERGARTIPLTPAAVALLRRHRAEQKKRRLQLGPAWRSDLDLVFPRPDATNELDAGRIWKPHDFSTAFRQAQYELEARRLGEFVAAGGEVEQFELRVVGCHEFRHLAATSWKRAGVRDEVLARWLGHSTAILLQTYSHVQDDEKRPAGLEAVDAVI